MFSSGLLIKRKTSLSNLGGIGSSIQVDDLDEDNVVVSYNQICFAFRTTHHLKPSLTMQEAEQCAGWIQNLVGLTIQMPVTLNDIRQFEQILDRKIVVFYREEGKWTISHFQTNFSLQCSLSFLFLFKKHYCGIENLKGFLGYKYDCNYLLIKVL